MFDEVGLRHPQCVGYPVEESEVGLPVEVHELADGVAAPVSVLAAAADVPLGVVDAVVDGLDAEQREC